MTPLRVGLGGLVLVAVVFAINCTLNVRAAARLDASCPVLLQASTERMLASRALFARLVEHDAALMDQLPQATYGRTCTRLHDELTWYRWNLGRTVNLDETLALRHQLIEVLNRAQPTCVARATVGIENDDTLHRELAGASCQVLKTLRATLDAPMQHASAWALADQLEHLATARTPKNP